MEESVKEVREAEKEVPDGEKEARERENGVPGGAQRSGSAGERTSGEMSELSADLAGSEGYGAREDESTRDFDGEVGELLREFPEAARNGRLPDEVVQAAVRDGKSVVEAYREYALARQGSARTAGWNADAARRAPVRGVSGGFAVEDRGRDAFMAGFEAE